MAQAPEEPRTRRNSDTASQYSFHSQFSWKGMIQPQTRYHEDGLTTFLEGEDETFARFFCQPIENQPSDQQEMPVRQRGRHLSSPVPGLIASSDDYSASSSIISSINPNQMYSLYPDSNGILYTRCPGGPVVINATTPESGAYRCLFAFDSCPKYCTEETWEEHVGSHLSGVEPPRSCKCSICGESFDAVIPALTWSRFLGHVWGHKYSGRYRPDQEFLEFCRENEIISDFTMNRLDPNLSTIRMSQEPYQYRNQTPRVFVNGGANIAQVDYPSSWDVIPEYSVNQLGIQVSRSSLGGRRRPLSGS